jgi:hypothetical protein
MRRNRIWTAVLIVVLVILACNMPGAAEPEGGPSEEAEAPSQPSAARTPPGAPEPPPEGPPAATALNVPLRVYNSSGAARTDEPVTSGVPLPRDLGLTDASTLLLVDSDGNPVPAQFTPLARWGGAPDDASAPIRWVLLDFQASVGPQETACYFLQEGGPGPAPDNPVTIVEGAAALIIDTGATQFSINLGPSSTQMGPGLAAPIYGRARSEGREYVTIAPTDVEVALEGPMRVSIHVRGSYIDADGNALVDYTSRYWFYAGHSTIRLFHTVENNALCPLAEDAQLDCYDIGDGGSVTLSDLSLVVPTDLGGGLSYQAAGEGEPASGDLTGDLVLYQDSSGTDSWDTYPTLVDWDGNPLDTRPRMQSYVTFRGYRTTLGGAEVDSGDHAAGWLTLSGEGGSWSVGVRDFWQNFPKALRAFPDGTVEIGLFPEEYGPEDYAFTLRAGEHKTHEIVLVYNEPLLAGLDPLFAQAPAEWYVDSGAFGFTALPDWEDWPDHEQYLLDQVETSPEHEGWEHVFNNIFDAIERTDFYGIFDYGDWPIDYEGYRVAPLNGKYDYDYGLWIQWARSGDPRWFELAEASDRHIADIDILHNLHSPRHWGDGTTFGHSYHDEEGFTNPHRNEGGAHPDVAYGMTGMLTAYYLTGYEKAFESAMELADNIEYRLHNDGYLCGTFADCNGEGWVLMEGMYDAGCRPAANSLSILVDAYRATGDLRYLEVADALVDWAAAGRQPYINGPTGADNVLRPWMLNMYLVALSDYIEMRQEYGLPDTYDAAGSYLAYADFLRTYALLLLDPIDTGPRAAYPYEWYFDERQGDPADEYSMGNNVPSINNWLYLGADAMAYAYRLSGNSEYMDIATSLFRTGSRDPWFEGDPSIYSESKQMINAVIYGNTFLYEWAQVP